MYLWILYLFVLDISCEIVLKVNEESLENTVINNIKKYLDSKYLDNQQLSYLSDGPLIKIDASGKMTLKRQIDLEAICTMEKLCCGTRICRIPHSVVVNKQNKFATEIKFQVEIVDINDQQPIFKQKSLSLSIKESAPINMTFSLDLAQDLDFSRENNLIRYELLDKTRTFVIDHPTPEQLSLRLVKPLDYEVVRNYLVNLNACDKEYCTEQAININVINVNDNKPIFNQKQYRLSVEENKPLGSVICQVNATDRDSEDRGLIRYQFGPDTDSDVHSRFQVDRHTGKITLIKSLSRGDRTVYRFTVIATDGGTPKFKDTTRIEIIVKDINNNAPQITVISSLKNQLGRIEILENYNVNHSLCTIKVVDSDIGKNSIVNCRLKSGEAYNNFRLTKLKKSFYALSPIRQFDYEKKALYSVEMVCRDYGVPMKTSSKVFLIHIKDVNEYVPEFKDTSYSKNLYENTELNTNVLKVTAFDKDGGANLTYKLEKKATRFFKINESTGQIKTNNEKLDREKIANILFYVYVTDATVDPRSASVKVFIVVDDENDNIPAFGLIPKFSVRENQVSTTLKGKLTATDKDVGANGNVTFTLFKTWAKQQKLQSIFYVTSQGQIQTLQSLDRETFSEYTLLVGVKDQGKNPLAVTANVTVTVLDENDNKPQWLIPTPLEPVVNISHNAKIVPGDIILTLRAFDPDDDDNGRVSYFLEQQGSYINPSSPSSPISSTKSPNDQNKDPLFQVDEISGELKLVRGQIPKYANHPNPNYRNSEEKPNLVVVLVARDNGKPKPRSSTLKVSIFQHTIIDETLNDNLLQPNATVIIILIASVGFILTALVVSIICIRKRPLTTDINHPANAIYSAKYSSCPAPINVNNNMYNNGSRLLNGSQMIHNGKQQYGDAEWNFQDVNNIMYGSGLDQTGANSMMGKDHANQYHVTDDKLQQPPDMMSRSGNNSQLSTVQMRMMTQPQSTQPPMNHHQQLPPLHHITSSPNSYEPIDAEESGDSGKGPSEDTRNIPIFDTSFFRNYAPTLHWKIPSPIPSSGLINSNRILFPTTTTTNSQLTNHLLPSTSVTMTNNPNSTLPMHFPNAPLDLHNPPPGFTLPRSPDYYTPGPGNSTKHSSQVYDSPDLFENGQSDTFENRTPDVIELAQIQQSNI